MGNLNLDKHRLNIHYSPVQLELFPMLEQFIFAGLKVDPEDLHHWVMGALGWLSHQRIVSYATFIDRTLGLTDDRLGQTLWGLTFPNPVGLAAGYDKDGLAVGMWDRLGFGAVELGTVTFYPQPGNPRPRLFRLTQDRAVLNRMGFNNEGAEAMAERLKDGQHCPTPHRIPIGINLGKSKITPLENAAADYGQSFRILRDWGDYFVVNVSSPNTPGLRSLQDASQLSIILEAIQQENQGHKPLLVKIAPDLEDGAIADVVNLAQTYQLSGIIATNTTINKRSLKTKVNPKTGALMEEEQGGISGVPLGDRSTEVIRLIWQHTQGQLPIIGVGGIFTPEDAWEKITAGASLIQVYTGWVYEGPWMVKRILQGLLDKLEEEGLDTLADAIGRNN
ncbi:quinone-dependent dihydroorotate dehydrogenase [Roseofilum reptotaenium CS-1145]|nr:quinone-dependent dihydroorotate dehydrogenase [Roseofilum reptotaenium]MDB9518338.1 quinone-dependent dihydroorotate dehydrogenase [Roseofilum reptotaenium CS-1145]